MIWDLNIYSTLEALKLQQQKATEDVKATREEKTGHYVNALINKHKIAAASLNHEYMWKCCRYSPHLTHVRKFLFLYF